MRFGAELGPDGTRFSLWAPTARKVSLVLDAREYPLPEIGDGWRELTLPEAKAGARYAYRIDEGLLVPDPASRFQPEDVPGRSMVVDPKAHSWSDAAWRGRPFEEAVIYEVHVGTATPQGSFAALSRKLDELADEGLTAIELMPIADFPGRRNWGYDGVLPFAPDASYGAPHELKRLIDRAHRLNLMVFIDVVYNHFGPSGNHLPKYAGTFFTNRHLTPWGRRHQFRRGEQPARPRILHSQRALLARGVPLSMGCASTPSTRSRTRAGTHVLAEIAARVRRQFPERQVHLVLENDANEARWLARDAQGRPRRFTAQWNDDFHHAWHILATGEKEGYYGDYADDPVKRLGRTLAEGFAYQGEASAHREGRARGEVSAHLPPSAFVAFLQNHDQIGNRAFGERLSISLRRRGSRSRRPSCSSPRRFRCSSWARIGRPPRPFMFFVDFGDDDRLSSAASATAGGANSPVSAPLPTRRRPRNPRSDGGNYRSRIWAALGGTASPAPCRSSCRNEAPAAAAPRGDPAAHEECLSRRAMEDAGRCRSRRCVAVPGRKLAPPRPFR